MLSRLCCRAPRFARSFYSQGTKHEPFAPVPGRSPTIVSTAAEAVAAIKSDMRIFLHSAAATPGTLVKAMTDHAEANNLTNIKLSHIHTECDATFVQGDAAKRFRSNSLFIGPNVRKAVNDGLADYTPVFLSEVPILFRRGKLPLDVAIIQVSPPDKSGYCSLGVSVDVSRAAVQAADVIIAQTNRYMPRTHGDGLIHVSHIDTMFECHEPIFCMDPRACSPEEDKIGAIIAENLVEDGATLQMGIGAIPDAVLAKLGNHKDLGVHTEMFSDGVKPLVECGALTNARKTMHYGKIVSSFVMGSQDLYEWMDDNPLINMLDVQYTNDTGVIKQQHKMTAINSCIEVDLTGQIVSDSIGTRMYSGVGGQVDFIRGAGLSEGGKPIIAVPSTTRRGESRIVPFLKEGGGIVTTRAHAHYVVTEYGVADLFGKNLRERARALIDIAHPDHREALEKAAVERLKHAL